MLGLSAVAVVWVLAQAPAVDEATRAAQAAERAAAAAERAATAALAASEAAQRAAERAAPPAPAVAASAPSASGWSGTAGLALISLTGNSSSLTFNSNVAVARQWTFWKLGFKGFATYGQARSAISHEEEVVAYAAGAEVRAERKVTGPVSLFLKGGAETNHVKSLRLALFGEAGASVTWVDVKEGEFQKSLVRADLSMRYQHEYRRQYYPPLAPGEAQVPDRDLVAPRLGLSLRQALTHEIIFTEDAEVLANVVGESRFLLNSITKLASRLTESVSLGVSFVLNHDSAPAPGKVPTDTALSVGVEVAI